MSFNYIETTYEPHLNFTVPLDESSLDPCPPKSPPVHNPEELTEESITDLNSCIKTVVAVQEKTIRLYFNQVGLAVCT